MTESKICTCPSGDGSLRWPCPAHPAVEQAGGDERAACNLWIAEQQLCQGSDISLFKLERNGALVSLHDLLRDAYQAGQARAALAQPSPALPPFAEKVLAKLRRFYDCASDFESGGVDIGRHWLDLLTQLGLLNRVQRNPALWEISQQGEDLLGAPQHFPARTEQANSGYDQLWAWFGLSRSAYAVLPRVMMHAMPDDWQRRFAELMDEWDDHWPNQPDINARVHITQNGLYISTPKWLLDYRHPDHNQLNAMRGKDEL
ncbi:TPA: hypothetical protein L5612_002787 [Pseudomonas aeruginosa]|nr:hypothetical protein [Pseudomonas aeruginosa]